MEGRGGIVSERALPPPLESPPRPFVEEILCLQLSEFSGLPDHIVFQPSRQETVTMMGGVLMRSDCIQATVIGLGKLWVFQKYLSNEVIVVTVVVEVMVMEVAVEAATAVEAAMAVGSEVVVEAEAEVEVVMEGRW